MAFNFISQDCNIGPRPDRFPERTPQKALSLFGLECCDFLRAQQFGPHHPGPTPTTPKMEMLTRYGDADRDVDIIWGAKIHSFPRLALKCGASGFRNEMRIVMRIGEWMLGLQSDPTFRSECHIMESLAQGGIPQPSLNVTTS